MYCATPQNPQRRTSPCIGRLLLQIGADAPGQSGSQSADTGRVAIELDRQPGHREHLIFQIRHQRAAHLQFYIDFRLICPDSRSEFEFRRNARRNAAGFQAEIGNGIFGPGGLVFPNQRGFVDAHAIDLEFDRRSLCLRGSGRFRRYVLFSPAEQIVEVDLAILVLEQNGAQPVELDLVHDDLPGKQRNQRQRNPHIVQACEILFAFEFGQPRPAQVHAKLREQHETDVAFDGQGTLRFLPNQIGDLRLVVVRIEGRGDECERAGKQEHDGTHRNQNPLQQLHGHHPALDSTPPLSRPHAGYAIIDWRSRPPILREIAPE